MPPPQGTWNPIEGPGDYTTTKVVHNDTYPAIDPTKSNFGDKAVFVSGASRGLGKAMALSFAKAGASQIAISARGDLGQVEQEIKQAAVSSGRKEPQVLCLKLEVTDAKGVEEAGKKMESEFGKLDVVINNAAVMGGYKPILESDPDEWWQTWNVNVRGPYLISRACIPLLLKGELKTLVTVSSVGALCTSPGLSDYQTSKLAVLRYTEFVAQETASQGIIAFAIHPGNILTDMVGRGEQMDDKLKAVFTESPQLCADSLVYLSNTKAEWLSGRYINCTWDLPELLAKKEEIVKGDMLKVKLVVP